MSSNLQLDFVTVDVFTTKQYEGNPLAIVRVPGGVTISQEQKQIIAREFNLSEATFLHEEGVKAEENVWTVDIFLTTAEIPFAGHPTIGTACYVLAKAARERNIQQGVVDGTFKLKAGPVALQYDVSRQTARAAIPHDVHIHEKRWTKEELFKLQPRLADAHQKRQIQVYDDFVVVSIVRGMTFALVELESLEALSLVSLAGQSLTIDGLDKGWDKTFLGTYFFVRMKKGSGVATALRTRMIEGPLEDPATGSAASALTAYLSLKEGTTNETLRYEINQGVEMGRRSEIFVDIEMKTEISKVFLEGGAVQVMEGRLTV